MGETGTVAEDRLELDETEGHEITGNLNTETQIGATVIHFNGKVGYQSEDLYAYNQRKRR